MPPYFWGSSHMTASQTGRPVMRLIASRWALSVTMKTLSPRSATPRLVPSDGSETRPAVRGREYCQICIPVRASSATTWFGPVAYMIPSATSGTVSRP